MESGSRSGGAPYRVHRPIWILPAIVVGQWMVTSLWFATNAVMGSLQELWGTSGGEGIVTTAVQLGFIIGTLVFALVGIADRFRATTVFLICAVLGAAANATVLVVPESFALVLLLRFLVGVSLAGVYPVGMRIAAGWYAGGLGRALGFLVGALVLGTASPHLLSAVGAEWDWQMTVAGTSVLALAGGLIVWWVPEGPQLTRGGPVRFRGVLSAFRDRRFRASACGYFGHMWELYAFWAFVPVWIASHGMSGASSSWMAFAVIGVGFVGCAGGGLFVKRFSGQRIALGQLGVSGVCCLVSPFMLHTPTPVFTAFMLVWGITVAGDSPQFSALTAQFAPREVVGSALTLVNSGGFAITILSLSLLEWMRFETAPQWLLMPLALGPLFGLVTGAYLLKPSGSTNP
ncbi:putative MFS family arabinose efflux permease [Halospina denitrificans]|uniref:Putative MFS family arabinose efflux permease n=2 Tax=Halospina denitrificans TaxID=332522 RepID=A0A4R7JWY1_9GAMM|nr:putative MFS family arabinose efflux permease [Halospina denitrificans]